MLSVVGTGTVVAETGASDIQPRLARAAHEFEAQMMKELLSPMTRGSGLMGDDDGSDAAAGGPLGEFASEALAGALSSQGGLGIANRIIHDLSHSGNQSETRPVSGKTTNDPQMRVGKSLQ